MSNRIRLWLAAGLLTLGVACVEGFPIDTTDTGGSSGCCEFECSDGSTSTLVAESASECNSLAAIQCEANGLDVVSTSWDQCSCEDCF